MDFYTACSWPCGIKRVLCLYDSAQALFKYLGGLVFHYLGLGKRCCSFSDDEDLLKFSTNDVSSKLLSESKWGLYCINSSVCFLCLLAAQRIQAWTTAATAWSRPRRKKGLLRSSASGVWARHPNC